MAGRPKGSLSRNKAFLLKRLQEQYGKDFHPIMRMAENAAKMQKIADNMVETIEAVEEGEKTDITPQEYIAMLANRGKTLTGAIDAWDKIAQYTEPKLKAMEVTHDLGETVDEAKVARAIARAQSRRED